MLFRRARIAKEVVGTEIGVAADGIDIAIVNTMYHGENTQATVRKESLTRAQ